jgi:hypothetical protein
VLVDPRGCLRDALLGVVFAARRPEDDPEDDHEHEHEGRPPPHAAMV